MVQVTPSTDIVHAMLPLGSANGVTSVEADVAALPDGCAEAFCPAAALAGSSALLPPSPPPRLTAMAISSTTSRTSKTTKTTSARRDLMSPPGSPSTRSTPLTGDQDHTGATEESNGS